jgi:hypothetical protein
MSWPAPGPPPYALLACPYPKTPEKHDQLLQALQDYGIHVSHGLIHWQPSPAFSTMVVINPQGQAYRRMENREIRDLGLLVSTSEFLERLPLLSLRFS